ncbi:hypothetical protein [Campylobacter canadensis]|uniref:Uncharacterized protein n=1 Tax=Campylobacter canadensis TaxID=449520 RepID=A0ABS7WV46_9BACT|nr:hypothetical protein [Campylobacter canadensis]MBZ7988197.1 hypothetical protein [Campylobacter canadensis]MBZ7999204.1 hypothetical protein [Campylobacter canadensis]
MQIKSSFINSKSYHFKQSYKDKYFKVVISKAQTNKGELSKINHFPKDSFYNDCYFLIIF